MSMRKTLWVLGIIAAISFVIYFSAEFLSGQVVLDNLNGGAFIAAAQSKINYNSAALIALIFGGVSTLIIAFLLFSHYLSGWKWSSKLP